MRKKTKPDSRKSLFDIPQSSEPSSEPKKRGRPKKTVTLETTVETFPSTEKKKRERPKKNKETIVQTTKPISDWKEFFSSEKPELMKPLEFYVDTGNGKQDIFRGYRKDEFGVITDEPYKLHVLRKRYHNLYYRYIPGCEDLTNCPEEFPNCEKCRRKNK